MHDKCRALLRRAAFGSCHCHAKLTDAVIAIRDSKTEVVTAVNTLHAAFADAVHNGESTSGDGKIRADNRKAAAAQVMSAVENTATSLMDVIDAYDEVRSAHTHGHAQPRAQPCAQPRTHSHVPATSKPWQAQ